MVDRERIAPIKRDEVEAHDPLKLERQRVEAQLPRREPRQPRSERPRAPADHFRPTGILERFVRGIAQRVEQGWRNQNIRLPGRQRVVQDRRGAAGEGAEGARRRETTAETAGEAASHRPGAAARGDRSGKPAATVNDPTEAAAQASGSAAAEGVVTGGAGVLGEGAPAEKPLSAFESAVVRRFEEAETQAKSLPDEQPKFLAKTAKEWKAFFQQFLPRTQKKQVPFEAVADTLAYRGIVQPKGTVGKGIIIGDLTLASGEIEKFARFELALGPLVPHLAHLTPGAALNKQVVAKGLATEWLEYLAIGPEARAAEKFVVAQERVGIFTSQRTEQAIAERLGLPLGTMVASEARTAGETHADRAGESGSRRHGKWFRDDEPLPDDFPGRFVPWWRWDRESRLGLRRWFVPLTLGVLVITLALIAWVTLTGR